MSDAPDDTHEPDDSGPRDHLSRLESAIKEIRKVSIDEVGMYGCTLRAALVKGSEFASVANLKEPPPHSFFLTATLRGVCEDLIVLTFLSGLSLEDKNHALCLLIQSNLDEGISSQADFFAQERPWQPVLKPKSEAENSKNMELRTLARKLGWTGKQPWPSVWYMAKAGSLESVYRFLYSATSKWVHFSPQILLRMGWGGSKDDIGRHTEWEFTTTHFSQYYAEFNQIYSILLLLKLLRGPAEKIVPAKTTGDIEGLEHYLSNILRWPEAVTFEELNLQSPNPMMRIALRVAHAHHDEDGEIS